MDNSCRKVIQLFSRRLHTRSVNGPSDILKKKISQIEKQRKKKNPIKDQLFVETPESKAFLDTASPSLIVATVGVAIFAKILMMIDESKSQERLERKIQKQDPGTGTVRMLSREEWDKIKDLPPRTPFESQFVRPNSRIRTGEPLNMEDLKDWTIDVLTDAFTRVEETVRHGSNK